MISRNREFFFFFNSSFFYVFIHFKTIIKLPVILSKISLLYTKPNIFPYLKLCYNIEPFPNFYKSIFRSRPPSQLTDLRDNFSTPGVKEAPLFLCSDPCFRMEKRLQSKIYSSLLEPHSSYIIA